MERSDKRQTLKLNTTGLVVPITLTILGLAADISEILLLNLRGRFLFYVILLIASIIIIYLLLVFSFLFPCSKAVTGKLALIS